MSKCFCNQCCKFNLKVIGEKDNFSEVVINWKIEYFVVLWKNNKLGIRYRDNECLKIDVVVMNGVLVVERLYYENVNFVNFID